MGGKIHGQILQLKHACGLIGRTTAQQHPNAGGQLIIGKGLDQIIISTGIQPGYPVLNCIPRRQQEHRRRIARRPQAAQQRQSIQLGKHKIKNHSVIAGDSQIIPSLLSVGARYPHCGLRLSASGL